MTGSLRETDRPVEESGFEPSVSPRIRADLPLDGVRLGAAQRYSEKRIRHKWDQRFESAFLQRGVYLSGAPRGVGEEPRTLAALCV